MWVVWGNLTPIFHLALRYQKLTFMSQFPIKDKKIHVYYNIITLKKLALMHFYTEVNGVIWPAKEFNYVASHRKRHKHMSLYNHQFKKPYRLANIWINLYTVNFHLNIFSSLGKFNHDFVSNLTSIFKVQRFLTQWSWSSTS